MVSHPVSPYLTYISLSCVSPCLSLLNFIQKTNTPGFKHLNFLFELLCCCVTSGIPCLIISLEAIFASGNQGFSHTIKYFTLFKHTLLIYILYAQESLYMWFCAYLLCVASKSLVQYTVLNLLSVAKSLSL